MQKAIVAAAVCAAILVAAVPAVAATPAFKGTVGPGFTISMTKKPTKAGKVKITVSDKSDFHNFHLTGPGVNVKTSVGFVGTLSDQPVGLTTAQELSRRMNELTALTASAERVLLAARRGGVEAHRGLSEVEQAVAAQIALEALVHTFSTADGGAFDRQHRTGVEHARAALAAGHEALDELAARRRGLGVALAIIVLCLIGLALKIRQVSAAGAAPPPTTPAGGR